MQHSGFELPPYKEYAPLEYSRILAKFPLLSSIIKQWFCSMVMAKPFNELISGTISATPEHTYIMFCTLRHLLTPWSYTPRYQPRLGVCEGDRHST